MLTQTPIAALWLILVAAVILGLIAWLVRRDGSQPDAGIVEHHGADETWHPAADLGTAPAGEPVKPATVAELAAEVPDELAPRPDDMRSLAPRWGDLVKPGEVPELLPIVPGRPYVGRHHEDTVEMHLVPAGWVPPVGARRNAALLDDTQVVA